MATMVRMKMRMACAAFAVLALLAATEAASHAQPAPGAAPDPPTQQLVILDTDIGDDIDDAFALALLLQSPEIKLLGITTTFGDTELRARLVDRYLAAVHRSEIPVAAGAPTPAQNHFTQTAYARQVPALQHPGAVEFLLRQIQSHPGQITLICIGPLFNVQAAIARDPATFRKLKRVSAWS
jgi:purine nucleosidase